VTKKKGLIALTPRKKLKQEFKADSRL